MSDKLRFFLRRLGERLWFKPLFVCVLSILMAFAAHAVDGFEVSEKAPDVDLDSIEMLLEVLSASMLVMAVFAVGSMIGAYQSASDSATPRSFILVVADDLSQNALSTFIGAFIFSIVAQVALMNGYYGQGGRFTLFVLTILVFALVIMNFIRWVDGIARLGRLSTTTAKVEQATAEALQRRAEKPFLGGVQSQHLADGLPVFATEVGFIQRIDMEVLQTVAKEGGVSFELAVLPGSFTTPDRPLAYIRKDREGAAQPLELESIVRAFHIGDNRTFDDDPRFGLITLSEIASRALSPAVNDPGTAIEVTGIFVRLFTDLAQEAREHPSPEVEFDRVAVPELPSSDLFEDAFHAIARDGAGTIEVVLRVLRALDTLASIGDEDMQAAARDAAQRVIAHAEQALALPSDVARVRAASKLAGAAGAEAQAGS